MTVKYFMHCRNICMYCVFNCVEITQDFLAILEKCPSKMRKKLTNHKVSCETLLKYSLTVGIARDIMLLCVVSSVILLL